MLCNSYLQQASDILKYPRLWLYSQLFSLIDKFERLHYSLLDPLVALVKICSRDLSKNNESTREKSAQFKRLIGRKSAKPKESMQQISIIKLKIAKPTLTAQKKKKEPIEITARNENLCLKL